MRCHVSMIGHYCCTAPRNEMLILAEIEQYGLDSFADADYIGIYGMPPNGTATTSVCSAALR